MSSNKRKYSSGPMAPFKKPRTVARQSASKPRQSGRYNASLNRRGVASKETGFVDLAAATYVCDTTGSITLLATIAQGASVNQRVGKKIMLKSIQIRGGISVNTTATTNDTSILIVYDRRPTGALPAITDVLVAADANAFNNDANSGRFKIVRRIDTVLTGNSTTPTTGLESVNVTEYIPLKGLPCNFKAAGTGAIGDIEEGALYLITVGSRAAGTTAAAFSAGFRTRFVDI